MHQTILVIDDDPVINEGVCASLRTAGFNVLSASSAEQAAEFIKIVLPDAIVLDRMLPGIDGVEFLKRLRRRGLSIPVLMLTALGDTDNAIIGLETGANDYMGKPFSLKELTLRVKNLLKSMAAPRTKPNKNWEWKDGEFWCNGRPLPLSDGERTALMEMTTPIGAITRASGMIIKRLRTKLTGCKLNLTIANVRTKGYRITTG